MRKSLLLLVMAIWVAACTEPQQGAERSPQPSEGAPERVAVGGSGNTLVPSQSSDRGTLNMQAEIVYDPADRQPAAGIQFFLMDRDIDDIQAKSGLTQEQWIRQVDRIVTPFSFCSDAAMKLVRPHIVEEIRTDPAGKASFKPVSPGTYYVTGYTDTRGGFAIWNYQVSIKPGANSVILNQANAGYFK